MYMYIVMGDITVLRYYRDFLTFLKLSYRQKTVIIIIFFNNHVHSFITTNTCDSRVGKMALSGSQSSLSSSSVNIVKKNTKSPVWSYFGLKPNESGCIREEDVDRPMCCECSKIVLAKGGNTTNLYWHLKEHHPTCC